MNCTRIRKLIDVERLGCSHATVVGTGGGANLCRNLVRCNAGAIALVDFDTVEAVNICHQEHMADALGQLKVDTLESELLRINAAVQVEGHARDFCTFSDQEIEQHFGKTALFIFAVDNPDPFRLTPRFAGKQETAFHRDLLTRPAYERPQVILAEQPDFLNRWLQKLQGLADPVAEQPANGNGKPARNSKPTQRHGAPEGGHGKPASQDGTDSPLSI